MLKALLIIDVQNDFVSGSLAVKGGGKVAHDIAAYAGRGGYDYIVTTQDWHIAPGDHFSENPDYIKTWPTHCVAGTPGAALHEAIKDLEFDEQFSKGWYSSAYSGFEAVSDLNATPLGEWLEDRHVIDVDICGIATDYCVKATALDAVKLGFGTTVLLPLTAAVSDEAAAVEEMTAAGILSVKDLS